MEPETPVSLPQEVCSIRIVFPVDTDDDAIAIKKQIGAVLSSIPTAHIVFSLATNPIPREGPGPGAGLQKLNSMLKA